MKNNINFVNLTPHSIIFVDDAGNTVLTAGNRLGSRGISPASAQPNTRVLK